MFIFISFFRQLEERQREAHRFVPNSRQCSRSTSPCPDSRPVTPVSVSKPLVSCRPISATLNSYNCSPAKLQRYNNEPLLNVSTDAAVRQQLNTSVSDCYLTDTENDKSKDGLNTTGLTSENAQIQSTSKRVMRRASREYY